MGLHLPQPFGSFITSTVMADEPPPPPPYGSADWYLEKTVALEKLTTNDEAAERWPINLDPDPDSTSANNKRHEAWLDEQEWPSNLNEWLSRKGHPLTPVHGEKYHHEWIDSHELRGVKLKNAAVVMRQEKEAEKRDDEADAPIAPYRPPADKARARKHKPHLMYTTHGTGLEQVEQDYERALALAGGEKLVKVTLSNHFRRDDPMGVLEAQCWRPSMHAAVAEAQRVERKQQFDAYLESAQDILATQAIRRGAALKADAVDALKWKNVGKTPPVGHSEGGDAIRNVTLEKALQAKHKQQRLYSTSGSGQSKDHVEFSIEEWLSFGVRNLSIDQYVKAGTDYWKPSAAAANAPTAAGYRPGSAAARRANDMRPPTWGTEWTHAPVWGRKTRW